SMWRVGGQLRGQPAAEGGTDDVRTLQPEPVEEVEREVDEVVDPLDPVDRIRLTEARAVGRDDVEAVAEQVVVGAPPTGAPGGMKQEYRLSTSRAENLNRGAVELERRRLWGIHGHRR